MSLAVIILPTNKTDSIISDRVRKIGQREKGLELEVIVTDANNEGYDLTDKIITFSENKVGGKIVSDSSKDRSNRGCFTCYTLLACQLPLRLRLFSDILQLPICRKQLYNQITHSPELTVLVSASTDSVFCFFGRSSLSSFEASVRLLGVELALAFSSIGLPASGPEP